MSPRSMQYTLTLSTLPSLADEEITTIYTRHITADATIPIISIGITDIGQRYIRELQTGQHQSHLKKGSATTNLQLDHTLWKDILLHPTRASIMLKLLNKLIAEKEVIRIHRCRLLGQIQTDSLTFQIFVISPVHRTTVSRFHLQMKLH